MSKLAIELEMHRRGLSREIAIGGPFRQFHLNSLRRIAATLIAGDAIQ